MGCGEFLFPYEPQLRERERESVYAMGLQARGYRFADWFDIRPYNPSYGGFLSEKGTKPGFEEAYDILVKFFAPAAVFDKDYDALGPFPAPPVLERGQPVGRKTRYRIDDAVTGMEMRFSCGDEMMADAGRQKHFRGCLGIGLLGLCLFDPATNVYARPITILSREAAEKLERDKAEAPRLLQRLGWQPCDKGNIGLLNGDWPGQNRAVIDALAAALRQAGYQPTLLDAPAFLNPFVLSPERFDLLIVTGGGELPVETAPALARFLKHQGNLIAIGTPLYADPVRRVQDGWMKPAEIRARLAAVPPARVLYDFEADSPAGWTRSSDKPDKPATFTCADDGAGGSKRALHVTIDDLTGWETFAAPPLPENTVAPTQNVLCFWAKSGERTKRLAIECAERDGSRWIATLPLQREWTQHALIATDFAYWHDSPTGQRRGGPGDRLQFSAIARITVGLAFTHTGMEGGRHEFWIDQVGFAQSPLADLAATNRVEFPPTELLWPSYKCYRTTEVQRIRPHAMQALIATPDLPHTQGPVVSPSASPRHGLQQEPPLAHGHHHRGRRQPGRLPRPRTDVDAPPGTRPAGPRLGDARVGRSGVSHGTAGGQRDRRAGRAACSRESSSSKAAASSTRPSRANRSGWAPGSSTSGGAVRPRPKCGSASSRPAPKCSVTRFTPRPRAVKLRSSWKPAGTRTSSPRRATAS